MNLTRKADWQPSVVQVGVLRIDRDRFEVKIREHEVDLSRKEFEVLWTLASKKGKAFRREELIERVWGQGNFVDARTVDVHIAHIRSKLDGLPGTPTIETVWGIGYRLKMPLRS